MPPHLGIYGKSRYQLSKGMHKKVERNLAKANIKHRDFNQEEALLEIMKTSLASGEDVLISGFGKFCVKEKAERKGRKPRTIANSPQMLPAH